MDRLSNYYINQEDLMQQLPFWDGQRQLGTVGMDKDNWGQSGWTKTVVDDVLLLHKVSIDFPEIGVLL
ncbi:hypothetical protein CDAR_276431 [Caerostris darwini]|uniref:Uncharacterized protein n=1 Tax=Caerostris darwini TaxID=1538125 RepID=A0AAV4QEJ7_9ARAC|nr:hypothetical protein CDAR_276431 [Caerostris darwini]